MKKNSPCEKLIEYTETKNTLKSSVFFKSINDLTYVPTYKKKVISSNSMCNVIHKTSEKLWKTFDRTGEFNFGFENCVTTFWHVFWRWFSIFFYQWKSHSVEISKKYQIRTHDACFSSFVKNNMYKYNVYMRVRTRACRYISSTILNAYKKCLKKVTSLKNLIFAIKFSNRSIKNNFWL